MSKMITSISTGMPRLSLRLSRNPRGSFALVAAALCAVFMFFPGRSQAGVIYMDENFEGAQAFVDRNWPAIYNDTEPSAALTYGLNLRRWWTDDAYSKPKAQIGTQQGTVVSSRAYRGAKSYQLTGGQSLAVTPGQFPFRNGSGSRLWQFAISTDSASAGKTTGTMLGEFEIDYASQSATSLTADTVIRLRLQSDGNGKAELVCVNNGVRLGRLTGAPNDWLLVSIIAMNRVNPGTLTDTVSHWITYDPLTSTYKGPKPGITTGISIFTANSLSGAWAKTLLKRDAGLPSVWGNYGNKTNTSEIGWRLSAGDDATVFVDDFYWDARTHESANGGFDHERGARIQPFPSGLRMSMLFTDNAVLQRGKPLPVFGTSIPGDTITLRFNGQTSTATADAKGDWRVTLGAMTAGGPYDMVVEGESAITVRNVMIGDVWVCSGQSNMAFSLSEVTNASVEVANANYPNIRLLTLWQSGARNPIDYAIGNWQVCTPQSASGFSAVAYFFGRDVYTSLNPSVPIGLINSSFGGTRAETWTSVQALAASGVSPSDMEASWGLLGNGELFNGMINPLLSFPITGVNWYQGESNSNKGTVYDRLLTGLIGDWRARWGMGVFPFQIVQLPNMEGDWGGGPWPVIREAQLKMLGLPNTALAVTIDCGTNNDVHPKNKAPVGHRLALAALAKVYGQGIEHSGPLLRQMSSEADGWLRIDFDHAAGLMDATGLPLQGFEVAGDDGVYYTAAAQISGNAARVQNASVPAPRYVRYAWSNTPAAELFNSDLLPASPFLGDLFSPPTTVAEWMLYP